MFIGFILGDSYRLPICTAPVGAHQWKHARGDEWGKVLPPWDFRRSLHVLAFVPYTVPRSNDNNRG